MGDSSCSKKTPVTHGSPTLLLRPLIQPASCRAPGPVSRPLHSHCGIKSRVFQLMISVMKPSALSAGRSVSTGPTSSKRFSSMMRLRLTLQPFASVNLAPRSITAPQTSCGFNFTLPVRPERPVDAVQLVHGDHAANDAFTIIGLEAGLTRLSLSGKRLPDRQQQPGDDKEGAGGELGALLSAPRPNSG